MLQELSVVEQRYLAVREVLEGAKVTGVAIRYGVDRRTVHRWLVRYANEGLGALADRRYGHIKIKALNGGGLTEEERAFVGVGVSRRRDTSGGWHQPSEIALLGPAYELDADPSASEGTPRGRR